MTCVVVFAVFAPDTPPVTVEQLPQATDQDNPIPLGLHQVANADTEQCLDSMLNNFQDVSINGGSGFGTSISGTG